MGVPGFRRDQGSGGIRDHARGKATYPAVIGLKESRSYAAELVDEAIGALALFDEKSDPLREIARYILARKS